ncbi:hypothetical protein FOL47_011058 [Perkinsus chesapeaki]|uniref:Peptidase A1 domain-containing protein n=1 Tax=Perkinsus chesapeaki TaxID=330153 RepID=A0A7J6MN66_PERCH|nr:hypothetical protein FOL47_011058 [Perkinsus chesapeaki]
MLTATTLISLAFSQNKVSGIAFDGQPLELYMDTGSPGTYVIYKDWYEKTYGQCPPKTCYTCVGPCDPYSEEKFVLKFDDGSAIETVFHEGVVELGGNKLRMKFRLIIGWSPPPAFKTEKPMNYFGLDFDPRASDESILTQLVLKKIVSEKTVSICAPSLPRSFAGKLILGSVTPEQCAITPPKTVFKMDPFEVHFNTEVSSYGLVSSYGQAYSRPLFDSFAIYDTGSYSITLYKAYLEFLLNTITEVVKQDSGLDVHVKVKDGSWYIQQRGYDYLPTLTFAIGAATASRTIHIPPIHYTQDCDGTWCLLLLQQYNSPDIILGRPFFTTHFSSFTEIKGGPRTVPLAAYANKKG